MNMKIYLLLFLLFPVLLFGQSKSKSKIKTKTKGMATLTSYTITADVSGFEDGTIVDLLNGTNGQPEGTTKVNGGKFTLTGKVDYPDYKLLSFNKQPPYITFFLENNNITIKAKKGALETAEITGSNSNNDFVAYNKIMKQYETFFTQNIPLDSPTMKKGAGEFEKFALQHPSSYVGPLAIYRGFQLSADVDKMEVMINKTSPEIRTTPIGNYIQQQIIDARKNPIGKPLADFSQADTAGNQVRLSSLRGKYVLVDFWASWCGPCRQENPNVLAAFQKYKNKNFTVLGVSLDKAKDPWLNAIHADNLAWQHVSDLKWWQNEVALQFGIQSIPQNFLVDPKGIVIGKNLRGPALEGKLAGIFGY